MSQQQFILLLVLLAICMIMGALFVMRLVSGRRPPGEVAEGSDNRGLGQEADDESDAKVRSLRHKRRRRHKDPTIEEQLFMAGRLSPEDRVDFYRKQKLAPVVLGMLGAVVGIVSGSVSTSILAMITGVVLGLYLPLKMLSGWVKKQHEELLYHLPLVIEQVSIGVSSSLDIGPCLSKIVEMADDRRSHNAVTRLLKYALMYVKSGVSLEEALAEIGKSSGHAEFKHATLALSQVAKFGGEISKQLQDLADSVSAQREAKVEATIRKLELKATGPVAMVFISYMLLLGLGIASLIITKI
jgi:Flp pilus assembly protein TadB